jgi:hypothetical protein
VITTGEILVFRYFPLIVIARSKAITCEAAGSDAVLSEIADAESFILPGGRITSKKTCKINFKWYDIANENRKVSTKARLYAK